MRKLSLALFLAFACAGNATAQEKGQVSVSVIGALGAYGTRGMGHSFQLKAAYRINRFSIGTGITYFLSGMEREHSELLPQYLYPSVPWERYTMRHLMLPLMLSYHAPMGQLFEFIPSAGLGASYTLNTGYYTQSSDSSFFKRDFTQSESDYNFRKINVWGIAMLQLSCKLNEQLALLAVSEFQGVLSNMYKPAADVPRQRQATLYFGLGMRYRFY